MTFTMLRSYLFYSIFMGKVWTVLTKAIVPDWSFPGSAEVNASLGPSRPEDAELGAQLALRVGLFGQDLANITGRSV